MGFRSLSVAGQIVHTRANTASSRGGLLVSAAHKAMAICLMAIPLSALAVSGLPNPAMTPGATNPDVTQATIHQTICVRGYTRTVRPPESYTEPLKRRQLRAYGYADQRIWHYEEDHLVPLEVGGSPDDPRNLWPEPRYGTWSAKKKDQLENAIHRRVCRGEMTLRQGQAIFEHDWKAGYRQFIHM